MGVTSCGWTLRPVQGLSNILHILCSHASAQDSTHYTDNRNTQRELKMALHRISSDHRRTPYPAPLLLRYNAIHFFLVNMLCMAQCTSAASTARGGFDGPAQLQGATVSPDWGGDITSSAPFGSQFFNDKELKRWQQITAISQHTTHPTGQNMNPPLHNAKNRRHMQEQPLVPLGVRRSPRLAHVSSQNP